MRIPVFRTRVKIRTIVPSFGVYVFLFQFFAWQLTFAPRISPASNFQSRKFFSMFVAFLQTLHRGFANSSERLSLETNARWISHRLSRWMGFSPIINYSSTSIFVKDSYRRIFLLIRNLSHIPVYPMPNSG
jgi:hypothetical protein